MSIRFLVLGGAAFLAAACGSTPPSEETAMGAALPLLGSMERLRAEFERHKGSDRMILFLSPT